jgi:hypothetical protein
VSLSRGRLAKPFNVFRNFPERPKRMDRRPRGTCSLSPSELDARIRELHVVRHRLLDVAIRRDMTAGEVRLAKHILRELDWYEAREAEPRLRAMREKWRETQALVRRVKKLAKRCGVEA